ncbi:unnamed protein product [Cochlearia groenlandica]
MEDKELKKTPWPVTLKGINYFLCARTMKIALGGRGLWNHILTRQGAPIEFNFGNDEFTTDDEKLFQLD